MVRTSMFIRNLMVLIVVTLDLVGSGEALNCFMQLNLVAVGAIECPEWMFHLTC